MNNSKEKSNTMIDVFTVPDFKGIFHLGRPTAYQSDCQVGQFKIKENFLGNKLQMEILSMRKVFGEFFEYKAQDWIEVLFVDENNTVSNVLFKTESIDNLLDTVKVLISKGKPIADYVITGEMRQKQSKRLGLKYYAVEFSWKENTPERIAEIKNFINENNYLLEYSMLAEIGERVNTAEVLPEAETAEKITVKKTLKMLGGKE